MILRNATASDSLSIIELLKVSLGESLIPKSAKLWNWKHLDNPFGKSPVIVAEEDGKLLGVRAFLKWEFLEDKKVYRACRAVDTATHPDHQGKGIFKKLTLSLIEDIKKEGIDLLFNTPNSKSSSGYLKMGWEKWGKLPLKLNFHIHQTRAKEEEPNDWNQVSELIEKIENSEQNGPGVHTRMVNGFLNWRYRDNPLFHYQYLSDAENYLLVYRIKDGKLGREFRICDFFTTKDLSGTMDKQLRNELNNRIKKSGCRFSSYSGLTYPNQEIIDLGIIPILKIGPIVTLRNVQEDCIPMKLSWGWSLGDLEVF